MNSKEISQRYTLLLSSIAHLSTFLNVLCGLFGINAAFQENFKLGMFFLILGAIFDFLDGKVAKMVPTESDLGVYLDSAADVVTFAVLPGYLLIKSQKLLKTIEILGLNFDTTLFIAAFFAICGWFRLVRFAMAPTGLYFEGLPAPAAAVIEASFCVVSQSPNWNWLFGSELVLSLLTIIISILMVTKIPFPSFKGLTTVDKISLSIGGVAAICYLLFPDILFASLVMVTFLFYVIGGSYYLYLNRIQRNWIHEAIKYVLLGIYGLSLVSAFFISL
ncbi:MAG: CDP-alcohol phosphatidyltransferase family protein [Candidatus Hodarchaeota archaeon]